jgi:hypothetical protein
MFSQDALGKVSSFEIDWKYVLVNEPKIMFMSGSVAPAHIDATVDTMRRILLFREEYESTLYKKVSMCIMISK